MIESLRELELECISVRRSRHFSFGRYWQKTIFAEVAESAVHQMPPLTGSRRVR